MATIIPEQVRRLAGGRLADEQVAGAQVVASPTMAQVLTQRAAATERTQHGSRTVDSPSSPALLWVGLYGGWVPS